jgi:hypothetical protein
MKLRDVAIGANASIYYKMDFKKIKGVFYPKTEKEVIEAIAFAKDKGYEVTPKGAGTGLSGACTGGNQSRVMISTLQMKQIDTISIKDRFIDVQAGLTPNEINSILSNLEMKFWVAPSSRDIATVGGLLSTDGGGNDAWINGTMRDNTQRVTLVTYSGEKLIISREGVKTENKELEDRLNAMGMNLHDVAASHGTLGFITTLRLSIRPVLEMKTNGAMLQFDDYDALGAGLLQTIERKCPIQYGEAIVMAHKDVREDLQPPILILEFPEDFEMEFCNANVTQLSRKELIGLQELRIKLPKRNPNTGIQVALFEGYGLHGKSLENMNDTIESMNAVLESHGFIPFAKYGHAPSKWYLGDNSPAYGLIMHSREIKPEGKTGREIFETVHDIVENCEDLGVTPKPEHKWPYSDEIKKKRIHELREVLGGSFNPFIFEENCASDTLASMV